MAKTLAFAVNDPLLILLCMIGEEVRTMMNFKGEGSMITLQTVVPLHTGFHSRANVRNTFHSLPSSSALSLVLILC